MSLNNVRKAERLRTSMPELHRSLIDIVSAMNGPERDLAMLTSAGLELERALFPLLVLVERLGPIGVVDLAGRVGRDYTTVSRQIARLEELGLVHRRGGSTDRRIREAVVTERGKAATNALDIARERMFLKMFQDWNSEDFNMLVRLLRMLANGLNQNPYPNTSEADWYP